MNKIGRGRIVAAGLLLLVSFTVGSAQQRLVVIGGGKRPPEAMSKFVEWAGGAKARILVITWATASPDASFDGLKKDLDQYHATAEHAPTQPLDPAKRAALITQIKNATGIFFGGGDQNRIMDVLADTELYDLMRNRYSAGVVFGGTSAGAAVLSDPMMTGDADLKILDGSKVGVRKGLGLVPNVIFDQHFLIRQRHNRLFGLMMKNPKMLGIGIDEDNAVLIEDNRRLRVVGTTWVMFVNPRAAERFDVVFAKPGSGFDIKNRKMSRR